MKVLYIDCQSGASGDMMLGAFLNLGVPKEHLEEQLNKLNLEEYSLQVNEKNVNGEVATDVDVLLNNPEDLMTNPYSGEYRNYRDIKDLINGSQLSSNIKALAHRIFDIKAKAESKVHEVPLDEVKFHEAGAVDSVVDIVGAAICSDYINADRIVSRNVPTGYGHVECACGTLTVPVPAVKQILKDTRIPYYRSEIKHEILTPTGASIIAGIADDFSDNIPSGRVVKVGYGTGKRKTGLSPLRLALCES